LMGARASRAARWAQVCMGMQTLGWLALAGSGFAGGNQRLLLSLAMLAFSGSLSALWWALRLWLTPRPGRALMILAPLLMPTVFALQFEDTAFRVGWANYWLALQLLMLALSLALPLPRAPAPAASTSASRRWRALMLLAVLPLALVLAWRGETEAELARLAQTDGLTGLPDRRAFAARAVDLIAVARRHQEPLALMVLDVDQLKALNAEHGRDAGDRVLALFGSCLQAQMRLGDLAGRIGGEEFAVLMARCEALGPQALDKRMREALAARAVTELGFAVDFSAGWAKLRHGDRNLDDLLRRAETALYEAKRGGRGRLMAEPGLEAPGVNVPGAELARALH